METRIDYMLPTPEFDLLERIRIERQHQDIDHVPVREIREWQHAYEPTEGPGAALKRVGSGRRPSTWTNLDTGETFPTCADAASSVGGTSGSLRTTVWMGRRYRGYRWRQNYVKGAAA